MDLRLHQFWILFLLLLMLMMMSCGVVNGSNRTRMLSHVHVVPDDCKYMLVEPIIFQRWCVGTYPWLVSVKYHDKMIGIGELYGLYLPRSQDSVLVLHKTSPLLKCRNLEIKNSHTFYCLDGDINETIVIKYAAIYCTQYHNKLPDDLMNECLKQNDFQHRNQYVVEVLKTRRCLLHYTYGEQGAQPLQMPIILLIVAVILQLH